MTSGVLFTLTYFSSKIMATVPFYTMPKESKFGSLDKSSPCIVCCGRSLTLNTRHAHLSTQYYNKQSVLLGDPAPYCYHCKTSHDIDMLSRTKVYLTTSTLYGVPFLGDWPGLAMHCDWEAVSGGTLDTMRRVWERAYMDHALPVDTIMIAGLNDIRPIVKSVYDFRANPTNQPDNEVVCHLAQELFMEKVSRIWTIMKDHCKAKDTDDTLAISRILHVPALYWTEDDGDLPHPKYVNYKAVVDAINVSITAYNKEIGSPHAPNLQRTGQRGLGRGDRRKYIYSRFREDTKWNMMHFADKYRIEIATRLYQYFEIRTPKTVNYLDFKA